MIITSSHKAWNSSKYRTIAISGNRGKDANYEGETYPALAPKKEMWKLWESCRNIPNYEDRNNNFYIENYYLELLQN